MSKGIKDAMLKEAYDWCNEHDKSTEFMLQYMQDVAGVDLDTVLLFLEEQNEKKWKKK